MGKQIRFYMTSEDEGDFLEFVRSTGDVVILPQTTDKEEGEEFSSFGELAGRRLGAGCHLWNRSISSKPTIQYFDVHGGCYCLDSSESEVVNVMRSKKVDQSLSMGRLHIEDKVRRPDGSAVEKSVEFVKWFGELCRWIRRTCPTTFSGACVSSRADALAKGGLELIGHRF